MSKRSIPVWRLIIERNEEPQKFRLLAQCMFVCTGLGLLTAGGLALRASQLTIGALYVLVVVAVALRFGFWQATLASLAAVGLLDFYFMPPLFSFQVSSKQDLATLAAFEATAIIVSGMSAREYGSALAASTHRAGMEKLYELSRDTLLLDMTHAPGPQLILLIQRVFGASGVSIFDANLGRLDSVGNWVEGEQNLAKERYLSDAAGQNPSASTVTRLLLAGTKRVGGVAIRGNLDPLVVDALGSLAATAIDRHQWFEKEERAVKARKSEEMRTAVMDALAHDFKTPLTAAQTASSGLLELGGLSDAQEEMVVMICEEMARLNALCSRLLTTAKLEDEHTGLRLSGVSLQELVAAVLQSRDLENVKDRIQLSLEQSDFTVHVDTELIAMILTQFIDNARKYSTPDSPIEVAARKSQMEVLISVHNVGSTIRVEDRERIFERFYRSPSGRSSVPGSGIGLSVARKAAEAHHGHVWVISDELQGTTFYLSLPFGARRVS
jgi:two-component system sensor histidine kinase KdpD